MSRRASLFARKNPGRRRVQFSDEVVFDDNVRENDEQAVLSMLRRASVEIDVNRINSAGLSAIHQAALDGNLPVLTVLLGFGADINLRDEDTWTPLHAACAMSHCDVVKHLLENGADPLAVTLEGQRPLDLVDPADIDTVAVILPATVGGSPTGVDSDEATSSDSQMGGVEKVVDDDEDDTTPLVENDEHRPLPVVVVSAHIG